MYTILLLLLSFLNPPTTPSDTLTVGKWKLTRKVPITTANRCYVDQLTIRDNDTFELIFITLISNKEQTYVYEGAINPSGKTTVSLGDGIAELKNFNRKDNKVNFRFEYGKNLGMFCTREKHPYPHKHLPHQIIGKRISDKN